MGVQHSWTVYSCQPFPNQGEHRASLSLLCLTRLTNHPDIPKQQFPAITNSRTHVPISCMLISSSVLDLGQISAPGCSRVRLLPLEILETGRSIPWLQARRALLPCRRRTQGQQLAAPSSLDACTGWEISAKEKHQVW